MSIRIMTQAWAADLPDSEKLVLLALADCANDEGGCWPSMATLAGKCSKSDRTVQAAIKSLVSKGHLSRIEKPGKGCHYYVHPVLGNGMQGTDPVSYHYTYRITCAETGEFYVGARSSYDDPTADKYMGSGKWIKEAVASGLSLEKQVLATFPSREALGVAEQELTAKVIGHPLCKNKRVASAANLSPFGGLRPEDTSPRSDFAPKPATLTPEASDTDPRSGFGQTVKNHQEPPKKQTKRALPDEWQPEPWPIGSKCRDLTDGWPPGEYETQVEHFTAHHRAKGSRFMDWQDAWKTWVLNSRKWQNGRTNISQSSRGSSRAGDGVAAALDRRLGFGDFAGPTGRRDAGEGAGHSLLPPPPRAGLR